MATIIGPRDLCLGSLDEVMQRPELVGFFLADFDEGDQVFKLTAWRAVPPSGYEYQTDHHVTLTDDAQNEAIRWAWNSKACLIEVHSHGPLEPAQFSVSDLAGFVEWVPHVRWRLRGRPYAAIVVATRSADAVAWTGSNQELTAVDQLLLDDGGAIRFTGRTMERLGADQRRREE